MSGDRILETECVCVYVCDAFMQSFTVCVVKKHVIWSYVTFLLDQFNQNSIITMAVNTSLILSNITGVGVFFAIMTVKPV